MAVQQLIQYLRGISAAQFAGIVILFFMPFVEVSCGNVFTVEISGKQFATGGEIEIPALQAAPATTTVTPAPTPGQTQNKNVDQKMSALIAWIAAAAGVVVSLMAGRNFRIGAAALAGIGTVCMFWLKSDIDKDFSVQLTQAQGILRLDYRFAFWACVILFITAAATNVYALLKPPNGAPRS